jgi:hypothetical protein
MPAGRRLASVVAACLLFGVVAAVVKGQDTGARDAVGNLSAPWMALAFLAGMSAPRPWGGAVVGVAGTFAAFLAFYATEAAVLDLGPHPWWVDLRLTLGSGRVYETWGVPAGIGFGALGALWSGRRLRAAPLVLGGAFVAEPLIVWALAHAHVWGDAFLLDYPMVWLTEVAIGIALVAAVVRRRRVGGAAPIGR